MFANQTANKVESSDNALVDLLGTKGFGIGLYKGSVVFIKRVYKRSIDLTRNVRKELIQVCIIFILNVFYNL